MKNEMKVGPFFDREYLKRAETREDRERLLQNIEWVSMVPAEEFLANLANIWLEMEDIYMEREDYHTTYKGADNFFQILQYAETNFKNNAYRTCHWQIPTDAMATKIQDITKEDRKNAILTELFSCLLPEQCKSVSFLPSRHFQGTHRK